MKQPAAKVNFKDFNRILKRDFQGNENEVLEILKKYKDNESYRVWTAILKLSNGDINKVKENVNLANIDYRDILSPAEYPNYSEKIGFNTNKFTQKEIDKIINDDINQYKMWFIKK